jgi:hypothetical protein
MSFFFFGYLFSSSSGLVTANNKTPRRRTHARTPYDKK